LIQIVLMLLVIPRALAYPSNKIKITPKLLHPPTPMHGNAKLPWNDYRSRTIPTRSSRTSGQNPTIRNNALDNSENDFLVTDSIGYPDELRPSFINAVSNPRDSLALILVVLGVIFSILNVTGNYGDTYQVIAVSSAYLGFGNSMASMLQVILGYNINTGEGSIRRGIVDDAVLTIYASLYSGAVSWQALRTGAFCPEWLLSWDWILPWMSLCVYIFSLMAPIVTFMGPEYSAWLTDWRRSRSDDTKSITSTPELSETERIRLKGILAIGILACLFSFSALSFALGGQDWWGRVISIHPSQTILESSNALFALYATEACMVSHRCGKKGVATYSTIVPVFALVCLILTIFPCLASLYWLGDDISFFSFYTD